jgi:hypothetical protein
MFLYYLVCASGCRPLRSWESESLTSLYYVSTPNKSFSLLHFTSDSQALRVVDRELTVAPSVLVRKMVVEEASLSDQAPTLLVAKGRFENLQASKLRCVTAHTLLCASNNSGDVVMHQSRSDYGRLILCAHVGNTIRCLATNKHDPIASAAEHANVQVEQVDLSNHSGPSNKGFQLY